MLGTIVNKRQCSHCVGDWILQHNFPNEEEPPTHVFLHGCQTSTENPPKGGQAEPGLAGGWGILLFSHTHASLSLQLGPGSRESINSWSNTLIFLIHFKFLFLFRPGVSDFHYNCENSVSKGTVNTLHCYKNAHLTNGTIIRSNTH